MTLTLSLLVLLLAACGSAVDVPLAFYCGAAVTVGHPDINGKITLFAKGVTVALPDVCEVTINAAKGQSLYLRFLAIDFKGCSERVRVSYYQVGVGDEEVFDSTPYFCGKRVISDIPVLITFDDQTTSYNIQFTKDSKDDWRSAGFTFEYTTKYSGSTDDLVWPVNTPSTTTISSTTATSATSADREDTTTAAADLTTEVKEMTTEVKEMTTEVKELTTEVEEFTTTAEVTVDTTTKTLASKSPATEGLQTTLGKSEKPSPSSKPVPSAAPTKPAKENPSTEKSSSHASTPPSTISTPKTLSCWCSMGFEDNLGLHHLLQNFPNLIPQEPYDIKVSDGPDACETAQKKCDSFCKLMVAVRMGENGLNQFYFRADFQRYLSVHPAYRPKLNSTIGGYVCEHYHSPLTGNGAELYVFSHLKQCDIKPREVHRLAKNFCCDGRGNHVKCVPPVNMSCSCLLEAGKTYTSDAIGIALPPPRMLRVISTPYCSAGSKQCTQYCRQAAYQLIAAKSFTYTYSKGSFAPAQTVGNRICSLAGIDIKPEDKISLRLTSAVNCSSNLVADLGDICCRSRSYASCATFHPPTTAPPSIRCECTPLYRQGYKDKKMSAVYKTTVPLTSSCAAAEHDCAAQCNKYAGIFGTKASIADSVCRDLGFSVLRQENADQTIELLALTQTSVSCPKPAIGIIAATIVQKNFCCTGGFRSSYKNCTSFFTTAPTTPRYTTPAPFQHPLRCACSPRYYSNPKGSYPLKTFSPVFRTTVEGVYGCYTANNDCRNKCSAFFQTSTNGGKFGANTDINGQMANDTCGQMYPNEPIDYSRLELYSSLEDGGCTLNYRQAYVKTLKSQYCCLDGQSIGCSQKQFLRTTPQPVYRCQCKPLYYNNTNGIESEMTFPAVYNTTISYAFSCVTARSECTNRCRQYGGNSKAFISTIGSGVCQRIYRPFKVKQPYQSFLEMNSFVDPAQCPGSTEIYSRTVSQDFCCSGAGGSRSSYVSCSSLKQQQTYTTKRPVTKKPGRTTYSCTCKVGYKYVTTNYIFKTVSMSSINPYFPKSTFTAASRDCLSFRSTCVNQCRIQADKYIKDGVVFRTTSGYMKIDDAVCKVNGKEETNPFDLVLKSIVSNAGCPTVYNTAKTYSRHICCNRSARATSCSTSGVIG